MGFADSWIMNCEVPGNAPRWMLAKWITNNPIKGAKWEKIKSIPRKLSIARIHMCWTIVININKIPKSLWRQMQGLLRWLIGSTSVTLQCNLTGFNSRLGISDPGVLSETLFISCLSYPLSLGGMLSHWSLTLPTSTDPIGNQQHFKDRVGESPRCCRSLFYIR